MVTDGEIMHKIFKAADHRYDNRRYSYWYKLFVNDLLGKGYRDIWVDSVVTRFGKIGLNIYDQYLVHEDKLFYRRVTSNAGRSKLIHDINKSHKKWRELYK